MQLVEHLDGTRVKSDAAFAPFRKSETSGVFWTTGGTTLFGFKRFKSSTSHERVAYRKSLAMKFYRIPGRRENKGKSQVIFSEKSIHQRSYVRYDQNLTIDSNISRVISH